MPPSNEDATYKVSYPQDPVAPWQSRNSEEKSMPRIAKANRRGLTMLICHVNKGKMGPVGLSSRCKSVLMSANERERGKGRGTREKERLLGPMI